MFNIFLSLGASAYVQLNQFEEAIKWCDKGLAVSFTTEAIIKIFVMFIKLENVKLLRYFINSEQPTLWIITSVIPVSFDLDCLHFSL